MKSIKRANLQLILVAIIIIVTVLYALFVKPYYYNFNGGEIFFEPVFMESFTENTTYNIHVYDGNIYISSINGFKKIASNGEHLWDQSYYAQNATLLSAGAYMCVVDINGKDAYLFNEDGLVTTVNTEFGILMADVNEGGAMTFLVETDHGYRVDIYNRLGKLAATREIIVEEDGFPIAMDLSPEGDVLALNHIVIDQGEINSNLTFLGFGDASLQDPNHIIGAQTFTGTWLAELRFYDKSHLIGISDQSILFYDFSNAPVLTSTYNLDMKVTNYVITEDGIMLMLQDPLTEANYMVALNSKGEEKSRIKIDVPLKGFTSDEASYYLITEYQIEKYDNNKRIWFTKTTRPVTNITSLGKEYYLIEYPSSYEIIKMKDI